MSVEYAASPPRDMAKPLIVIDELASLLLAIDPANIVLVTVPVSPVVTTVPVTSGRVMVRSAVGSITVKVVSNSFAVAPSNTTQFPSTIGEVRVLFVRTSVVARPTRVSVDVGSVKVPVFVIVEITGDVKVLFVRVSDVLRPTNVSVASGSVRVRSSVGSPTVNVVSYESATAPSNTMLASDKVKPETTGDVRVLLVKV